MVGDLGVEPRFTESESVFLPIGRIPIRVGWDAGGRTLIFRFKGGEPAIG